MRFSAKKQVLVDTTVENIKIKGGSMEKKFCFSGLIETAV
jgi:hypothetical protein